MLRGPEGFCPVFTSWTHLSGIGGRGPGPLGPFGASRVCWLLALCLEVAVLSGMLLWWHPKFQAHSEIYDAMISGAKSAAEWLSNALMQLMRSQNSPDDTCIHHVMFLVSVICLCLLIVWATSHSSMRWTRLSRLFRNFIRATSIWLSFGIGSSTRGTMVLKLSETDALPRRGEISLTA